MCHVDRGAKDLDKAVNHELLRWHPDKFRTLFLPLVVKDDTARVQEVVDVIARVLTDIKVARRRK